MDSWWKLSKQIVYAQIEAQRVISLRLLKLLQGGPAAAKEAEKMVLEKVGASFDAAATLATGGSPAKVVGNYRRILRANESRLTKMRRKK